MSQQSAQEHPLDNLTGGAFSAPTSGERAARVRDWLASGPTVQQMQEVFRELSARDKGAARALKDKLDEIKRTQNQEAIAATWAQKAQTLLAQTRLPIADALAWQRDAARAGAPLSREPLLTLKAQLAERVRVLEDLQHRAQVQREAAVLMAQRIELLSTKPWAQAQAACPALEEDVRGWQLQVDALMAELEWQGVDPKYPPLLAASRSQLLVVWEAFQSAWAQAQAAQQDANAPLPAVSVWAQDLQTLREQLAPPSERPAAARPKVDPVRQAQAQQAVQAVLTTLESELTQGHGKASTAAANALRAAMKEHGRLVGDAMELQAQAALAAAGELEGWQRWRADQLRTELVAQAEGLFVPGPDQQRQPRYGGRKMQETLRALREQWKTTDQGGQPNHALWKRFDHACNAAYEVVQAWLDQLKTQEAEHRAQRQALIAELQAWAADNTTAKDGDWKGFGRVLHEFSQRWRDAGHLGEKAFAQMQSQWKEVYQAAAAPLEAMQTATIEQRKELIAQAQALASEPHLRLDAVRTLQQRWQAQAQTVPLDRRLEQKLWDAFRKPIDEAFARKAQEREQAHAALSERDRAVLEAAKALDAATARADAQAIRTAMQALEAAMQAPAAPRGQAQTVPTAQAVPAVATPVPAVAAPEGQPDAANAADPQTTDAQEPAAAQASAAAKPAPKPVVAMRGDDRPGMKKSVPVAPGRPGQHPPGARAGAGRGQAPGTFGASGPRGVQDDAAAKAPRWADRPGARPGVGARPELPRLGDAAFRAQRDAVEHAQLALKKLGMQAHGVALMQLLGAWAQRQAAAVPTAQDLGRSLGAATHSAWVRAIAAPVLEQSSAAAQADEALLRLEIAAQVPTPAEHLDARRALQLKLLTRRNDPAPEQTWPQDVARVFASAHDEAHARRMQTVLKALLRS